MADGGLGGAVAEVAARVDAVSAAAVEGVPGAELAAALAVVEKQLRRLEAVRARWCAELAGRQEAAGRSEGSASASLAGELGVTRGAARAAIEAGRRAESAAGKAFSAGEITSAQERVIGQVVAKDAEDSGSRVTDAQRRALEADLARAARKGLGPRDLMSEGTRRLNRLDPSRAARLEARQQQARAVRMPAPGPDGVSAISITCEPRLRALLDAVVARFGGPGQCIAAPVDPQTGEPATPEDLAKNDARTPEQRAYDALSHVISLGLDSTGMPSRGIASIVVRVSAEQLDTPGELVQTDAGTDLTVAQAVSMAGRAPWFVSLLRENREELHRIDVDSGNAGGRRRLATTLQRLVLYAAHRGCTHPECSIPAARCQAHHVHDHSRGGPTTVVNAICA